MSVRAFVRRAGNRFLWRFLPRALRVVAVVLAGAYFVGALVILALRYYVLPEVGRYRDDIAAAVSRSIGEKVTFGAIEAHWYGLHPYLTLSDVRIHDRAGEVALSLDSVRASIAWSSLYALDVRFSMLALDGPQLRIRRDEKGAFSVAGFEVSDAAAAGGGRFGDWLLRQDEILVSHGRIEWEDASRAAPPLVLKDLEFRMVNSFLTHHFALRAVPPPEFAAALDVRGSFSGRTLASPGEWTGRLYAGLDYADLEAWKIWLDYPFSLDSGSGAVRVWLTLHAGDVTEVVADLGLDNVRAQLDPDLPEIDLEFMRGRLGVRESRRGGGVLGLLGLGELGEEVFGKGVTFGLQGRAATRPTDFRFRYDPSDGGRGDLHLQVVELQPLGALAESVPLTQDVRDLLERARPEGVLREVTYTWRGAAGAPDGFRAAGRFERLGMQPQGDAPGFSGLSGTFNVGDRDGNFTLDAHNARIAYPQLFRDSVPERPFEFDSLAGHAAWRRDAAKLQVNFDSITFANANLAGTASGNWNSGGVVDLTVRASRADGRLAYRFVPGLRAGAEAWLKQAVAGDVRDLRLHLKGALADFPFDDPARGTFDLTMKLVGGDLAFAREWPRIEGITADLRFHGRRMDIAASSASTGDVDITRTRATIPDLFGAARVLEIDGRAEGAMADLLRYVNTSPVSGMIGGAAGGVTGGGRGKLALKLEIPLDHPETAKVAGNLQFGNASVQKGRSTPVLTHVNGTIGFSEKGVREAELSLHALGGTSKVSIKPRLEDVAAVSAQGTVSLPDVLQVLAPSVPPRVHGVASYRVHGNLRGGAAEIVTESTLQGVDVDLPPPFGKRSDETWLTRIAYATSPSPAGRRDQIAIAIGNLIRVQALVRRGDGGAALDRAAIGLGGVDVTLPRDRGTYVTAQFETLDVDRLRAALKPDAKPKQDELPKQDETPKPDEKPEAKRAEAGSAFAIDGLNLKADTIRVFGREVHDVTLQARGAGDQWQANIASREANGDIRWSAEGKGAAVARLTKFVLPPAAPDALPEVLGAHDLPGLDVIADNFLIRDRSLGRLEVQAVNLPAGWRINRLTLTAPEGSARADGLWRPPGGEEPQRTAAKFSIEAKDVGAYLARFGYAGMVTRGTAQLSGEVSWNGPIHTIDYPSLAGNVKLDAAKGQFLKVEPGAGRLLGVLSLQSLPRRITLDFRDVFSDGFAFDVIKANGTIANGVVSTTDFAMVGPSARVVISGTADVARETQDLRVRVVPTVGDSVSTALGIALLNPALAIGSLLAQRILDDPLGQMLARDYHVNGSWSDPKVEQIRAPARVTEVPPG